MGSRLRILAGPCPENLTSITEIVNTPAFHEVSSDAFEGKIAVHVKDFTDENGVVRNSEYFEREDRQGITWSIQVVGRFLQVHSADDILFGNIFERPLSLPWGSSAVLKFMQYIDPTLEHDLFSQTKPWALSPLISTMPHFAHKRVGCNKEEDKDPTAHMDPQSFLRNDFTGQLCLAEMKDTSAIFTRDDDILSSSSMDDMRPSQIKDCDHDYQFGTPAERRKYFSTPEHRRAIQFGPDDIILTDFCYGFLKFYPTIALWLPGGLTFDLPRYWDGQPVMFVCCERGKEEPWERVFWCVVIERVE